MSTRRSLILLILTFIVLTSFTTACQSNSNAITQENEIVTEEPEKESQENSDTDLPDQNWVNFDNGLYSFIYPSNYIVRETVFSNAPAIAISTSEEAIASLEDGNYQISSGEIIIAIYQLVDISENNPVDIVAGSTNGSDAVSTYATDLNNSGYTATLPETIQFDNKTVYRSGSVLFGTDQLIYGWEQNIIYVGTMVEEMQSFQLIVETIIDSIITFTDETNQ